MHALRGMGQLDPGPRRGTDDHRDVLSCVCLCVRGTPLYTRLYMPPGGGGLVGQVTCLPVLLTVLASGS